MRHKGLPDLRRPSSENGCLTRTRRRIVRDHRPAAAARREDHADRPLRRPRAPLAVPSPRLGFDYGCLLAALRATGADPQPSLVLLAYSAVGIVALLAVTPGGLGIEEASLSGLLILAGVGAGYAVLATLAYRIASYWLPLLAGPPAYLLFRHRHGRPVPRRATPSEDDPTA